MASEAAQEDLTEFFEMWGFFVTVDTQIDPMAAISIL